MDIKGVIFDLDGTLVDSVPLFMSAYKHAVKKCLNKEISDAEIISSLGPNEVGVFKGIAPDDWSSCLEEFYKYEKKNLHLTNLFDGVHELLEYLKSNRIPIGLVTGRAEFHASLLINKFDLNKYLDFIEVGQEKGITKQKSISKILEHWSINSKHVLYVGDTQTDIDEAMRASAIPILVNSKSEHSHLGKGLSHVNSFESVSGFYSWIKEQIR